MLQQALTILKNNGVVTLLLASISVGIFGLKDRINVGTIIDSHEARLRAHDQILAEMRSEAAATHDAVLDMRGDLKAIKVAVTGKP